MATFIKDDGAIEMIIDDSNEVFGRMYRSLVDAWTRFVGQCRGTHRWCNQKRFMMDEEKVKKAIKASAAPIDFFRHASALGLFAPYRDSHLPRSDGFFEWLK